MGSSLGSSHTQKSLGVLDLFKQERVDKGIETDGSNLSGVSAKCAWDDLSRPPEDDEDSRSICIGTQPRRLSGKGKRSWAETLSWPFGLFSDGSGQWAESCSILGFITNTTFTGRLSMSPGSKMNVGVASLRKARQRKRDLCIVFRLLLINSANLNRVLGETRTVNTCKVKQLHFPRLRFLFDIVTSWVTSWTDAACCCG